jgi:ornithine cyclodeaminase/alanine dehydrogenase-like protein (mu-crystallin family)
VLERAAFVSTDSRPQAQAEAGDLIDPAGRGLLDWADVHELQELVVGAATARESDDDIVLFKSNGLAAWDLAAAARVVDLLTS